MCINLQFKGNVCDTYIFLFFIFYVLLHIISNIYVIFIIREYSSLYDIFRKIECSRNDEN